MDSDDIGTLSEDANKLQRIKEKIETFEANSDFIQFKEELEDLIKG